MINKQEKITFLRRVFGGGSVGSDGVNVAVMCPNGKCGSRKKGKYKLSIHILTDQCHCWVCGLKTHNSLIPILRKVASQDEIKTYLDKFSPNRKSFLDEDGNGSPEHVVRLPRDFCLIAMSKSTRKPSVNLAKKYLMRRGIGENLWWKFRIGVSNELNFERRVIIPSFDADGFVNTFAARAVDKKAFPNYLIPKIERTGIVFNEINVDWNEELTLVEGPFDLIKCVGNATCLQGSTLTEDHLLFWRIITNQTPVLLALDSDATRKTVKIAKLLSSYGIAVRILDLGDKADVGEMTRPEFLKAKEAAKLWSGTQGLRMIIDAWSISSGSS